MSADTEQVSFFLKPMVKVVNMDDRFRQIRLESEIRLEIFRLGFKQVSYGGWRLNEDDLATLYPNLPAELQEATREHLLGAEVMVVLLEGDRGIIGRFADYAGREVEPAKCAEHTVRYRYGSRQPKELKGGLLYWENVIHRPKNAKEAARDIQLFFGR